MTDVQAAGRFHAHTLSAEEALEALAVTQRGLSTAEAAVRLKRFGQNALPRARPPGLTRIFLR